jgi:hypothetical protein
MDYAEELSKELSRYNIDRVVSMIGGHPEAFSQLFRIFEESEPFLKPRVAWAVAIILDQYPYLGIPYQEQMSEILRNPLHPAVTRTIMRYFSQIDIQENLQGEIYEKSIKYLMETGCPPAIRVHSMQIMFNLGTQNPDLLNELKLVLEEILPYSDGGVLNRGTKLLKKINSKKT